MSSPLPDAIRGRRPCRGVNDRSDVTKRWLPRRHRSRRRPWQGKPGTQRLHFVGLGRLLRACPVCDVPAGHSRLRSRMLTSTQRGGVGSAAASRDDFEDKHRWHARGKPMYSVVLIIDDRNRIRADCRCTWRSPWITPDEDSTPRQMIGRAGGHPPSARRQPEVAGTLAPPTGRVARLVAVAGVSPDEPGRRGPHSPTLLPSVRSSPTLIDGTLTGECETSVSTRVALHQRPRSSDCERSPCSVAALVVRRWPPGVGGAGPW